MLKFFLRITSLIFLSTNLFAHADGIQLPLCPNGAKLTGGYAPSPWPTCPGIFSVIFINCMDDGKSEEECLLEMQAAADAKDIHSQCLWKVICENKSPASNKVVTRDERMNAELVCREMIQ